MNWPASTSLVEESKSAPFIAPMHCPLTWRSITLIIFLIDEQKKVMPEFMDYYCVFPSFITDGCTLECITDCEYDFLIANHMIEHARNCFDAILNHLRVIKPGGHLLYAVPDKNHTFDKPREMTTYEHLRDELPNGGNKNQPRLSGIQPGGEPDGRT